jgi:epoxyqueuosine reductase
LQNYDGLKELIKTEAQHLGFSHIGYCQPTQPPGFEGYQDWVNQGFSAEMAYLQRSDAIEKRRDPKKLLESVKTILVLAMPYQPSRQDAGTLNHPQIASYARGEDYHLIIPAQLEKFASWLETQIKPAPLECIPLECIPLEYKIYTDSGPVLERSLAALAGLGWIGKNSCLIIPGQGSFFFLAEILLNLEFTPDAPALYDYCGTCRRCIDACPTRCIQSNKTIDSSKCISYLTIENKKGIPEELREKIGSWVFGCDICQQVCPWNIRFSKQPAHSFFQTLPQIENFGFETIQALDEPNFKKTFSQSPILRAKFRGLKRNTITAIGNSKNSNLRPTLRQIAAEEEDPMLLDHANWAMDRLAGNL